jgi:hypothetical protein
MAELVDDDAVLGVRVESVRAVLARDHEIPVRIAASVTQLGLVARLVSLAIGLTAVTGDTPDLTLADTWWQPEVGGAFPVSLAGPRAGTLGGLLRGPVAGIGRGTQRFGVSDRIVLGNVASAINGAATVAGAPGLGRELLADPLLRNTFTHVDGRFRRLSCCLIYQAGVAGQPRSLCGDCVLTSRRGTAAPPSPGRA